jgi:hypothetical protein
MFKKGEILAEIREETSKKRIFRKPRGKIFQERKSEPRKGNGSYSLLQ